MNIPLLLKVRAQVLQDYTHLNMGPAGVRLTESQIAKWNRNRNRRPYKNSCGSVGCLALHTLLAAGAPVLLNDFGGLATDNILENAAQLLELSYSHQHILFFIHYKDTPVAEVLDSKTPGTKAYAKAVAEGIDWFVQKHATKAKAKQYAEGLPTNKATKA